MLEIQSWMQEATLRLQKEFGTRLLFVGLQGSRRRGEAREDSDIDIMLILDKLDVSDLAAYRNVLLALPEGEKASGFTCGKEELLAWPPYEIFAFALDTDAYCGDLAALLPPFSRADIIAGARMSVSGLHHYTAYLYVSGDEETRTELLKDVYKSFFFALQVVEYLRSGVYSRSKAELLIRLDGDEKELLRLGMDRVLYKEKQLSDPDSLFKRMLTWTGKTMKALPEY